MDKVKATVIETNHYKVSPIISFPMISGTLSINSSYRTSFSNPNIGLSFLRLDHKSEYIDMTFKYIAGYNFCANLAWAPKNIRIMSRQMINEFNVQVLRMYFFSSSSELNMPVRVSDIFTGFLAEPVEIFIQGYPIDQQ